MRRGREEEVKGNKKEGMVGEDVPVVVGQRQGQGCRLD